MRIFDRDFCVSICNKNESPYVRLAIEDLRADFCRVSGSCHAPVFSFDEDYSIIIEKNTSPTLDPISDESFTVTVSENKVRICAPTYLGTMWGIYTFSERVLGVNPCYLFDDLSLEKKESVEFPDCKIEERTDGFKFRGIFINDEDFLTGWREGGGIRHQPTPWYKKIVHPSVIDMVVETALRLKFNLVIPATYLNIDNPAEKAIFDSVARRGIYISQHHLEPLGVSSFTFENYVKKFSKEGKYSYFANPELFEEVWRYYAARWAEYDNVVWQVGLRGIEDRPMWQEDTPTDEELQSYGALISSLYSKEKEIVEEITGGRARHFTSTLWMEGASLMAKGYLNISPDIITVFADAGPSQTYTRDFYNTPISSDRKYGIYYHLQYFDCGPHIVPETGLDKLYYHTHLAYDRGCREYFIMNASNLREFTFELLAYSRMARSISNYSNEAYLASYSEMFFDKSVAIASIITKYYSILPEMPLSILPLQYGKYFDYHMEELAPPMKTFIVKDGIAVRFAKVLTGVEAFYLPLPDARYEAAYSAVMEAIPKYEALSEEITALLPSLPPRLKKHIEMKWLLYTDTHLYLYKCYSKVFEAKRYYDSSEDDRMVESLLSARECVYSYLKYRKRAEYGEFVNWYRGDTKLNIKEILYNIDFLLGVTPDI